MVRILITSNYHGLYDWLFPSYQIQYHLTPVWIVNSQKHGMSLHLLKNWDALVMMLDLKLAALRDCQSWVFWQIQPGEDTIHEWWHWLAPETLPKGLPKSLHHIAVSSTSRETLLLCSCFVLPARASASSLTFALQCLIYKYYRFHLWLKRDKVSLQSK